jgi:hypothetical protein
MVPESATTRPRDFALLSQELANSDDVAAQMLWCTTRAKVLATRQLLEVAESLARQTRVITEETDALNSQGLSLTTLAEVLLLAGRQRGRPTSRASSQALRAEGERRRGHGRSRDACKPQQRKNRPAED